MKSITLKLNNGRIQRPEFRSMKNGRDLQERSEKLEMFESLQSDLKNLKDAAERRLLLIPSKKSTTTPLTKLLFPIREPSKLIAKLAQ